MLLYLLWKLEVCASNSSCWPSRLGGQVELWGMFHYLILCSSVLLKKFLFTAVLDLPCCSWPFPSCGERCVGFSLGGFSCWVHRLLGAQAQLSRSVWDVPGPETEPVSPALVGAFFTPRSSGKSLAFFFFFLAVQLVGSWFSAQGLNLGSRSQPSLLRFLERLTCQ